MSDDSKKAAAPKPPAMRKFGRVEYPAVDFVLCEALKDGSLNGIRFVKGRRLEVPKSILGTFAGVLAVLKPKVLPAAKPQRSALARGNWKAH